MMKTIFGALMILGGIALGLYVGLWVCFIGGIVGIINEVKAERAVDAMTIAWNIAKIALAGGAGMFSAFALVIPGVGLLATSGGGRR